MNETSAGCWTCKSIYLISLWACQLRSSCTKLACWQPNSSPKSTTAMKRPACSANLHAFSCSQLARR
ncbi:hypothetical protein PR003_g21922 [Phytophthora rubi]|uniref:Uncharacterized protein n=1 Tax=Phytophthora rubi TaxID=129364 RepID=A0A6A4DA14_9STRA|nr:hypothetical protein PR001_g20758 [Phytophthora rubi]KAE9303783.1 hypothetical protein PR003_g21922 [Phytophthora rubi]